MSHDYTQTAAQFHNQKLQRYEPEPGYPPLNQGNIPAVQPANGNDNCTLSQDRANQYALLLEAASDLVSPDHYAHEIPLEVRLRFSRILSMGKKLSGVGYEEPPPPRCAKCDES